MVIGGRIPLNHGRWEFGLGSVLDTFTDPGWGPAHVELGIVTREDSIANGAVGQHCGMYQEAHRTLFDARGSGIRAARVGEGGTAPAVDAIANG